MARKSNSAKKEQRFSFQLGLSGIVALLILTILGMAWSFILGVVVGRGYQPEAVAREIARKVLPEDLPLLTEKNEDVLKGEELEFFDKLKQGPSSVPVPLAEPPKAAPPKPESKPAVTQTAPPPAQPSQATPPAAPPAKTKDEVFVFNYQVAALVSMEQAQAFLKKLEPGGFKTSVITATHEGKTWYRVYVHHQGTVESALALKEKLKTNGINNVLLRARTPL